MADDKDQEALDGVKGALFVRYGPHMISTLLGALMAVGGFAGWQYVNNVNERASDAAAEASEAKATAAQALAIATSAKSATEFLSSRIDTTVASLTDLINKSSADRFTGSDANREKERVDQAFADIKARVTRTEQTLDRIVIGTGR